MLLFVALLNAVSGPNFLRKFGAIVKWDYATFAT